MELRSRHRLQLRRAAMTAALGALLVPATAGAAAKKTPSVTKITPKTAHVGQVLTITGRNFRKGKGKNQVLFKRDGGKSLFVKAGLSTAKKMTVAIPKNLEKYMVVRGGTPSMTRFRVRILSARLSKSFTAVSKSPQIGPELPPPPPPAAPALDPNGDADGDGLTNGFELGVTKTDPSKADTDGDGVPDGYEYRSAVDLNNDDYRHPVQSLPYPGKKPYPNPLWAGDANTDFDGDSLYLSEEYKLWRYTVQQGASPSLDALTYSDGLKYSIYTADGNGRHPALPTAGYIKLDDFKAWLTLSGYGTITWRGTTTARDILDFNRSSTPDPLEDSWLDRHGSSWAAGPDGYLSDDERDEDADGLSNFDETHGTLQPGWWTAFHTEEVAYPIAYEGTDVADPDSDGDGVRDGADDQDHDDIPNIDEVSRVLASGMPEGSTPSLGHYGRVNPFNPCLPDTGSRTCPIYVPANGAWAPFDNLTATTYKVVQ
jgi:hypothetical protein